MKIFRRLLILYMLMFCCMSIFAQSEIPEPSQEPIVPYRLFGTQNMWTFIELDTATGKMWQVHFDIEGDNRGTVILSSQDLTNGEDYIPGRFTLHPTENIYTFILHDQIEGRSWQVQWAWDKDDRFIIPIY